MSQTRKHRAEALRHRLEAEGIRLPIRREDIANWRTGRGEDITIDPPARMEDITIDPNWKTFRSGTR